MMQIRTTTRSAWSGVFFMVVSLMAIVPSASLGQPSEATTVTAPTVLYYTVRRGDSLALIAQRFYQDFRRWKELYEANRDLVERPRELEIGWVLIIPNPIVIPPLALLTPALGPVVPTISTSPATALASAAPGPQAALAPVAPPPSVSREWASMVPLSPPRRQPVEFLERVSLERPPKPLELVSILVSQPPSIDGWADELVWQTAPAITTLEASSQRQITLKSVHTADMIFFLVSYPDQAPSETHESWGWDLEKKMYKQMGDRQDAFVFKWSMVGNQVNLALSHAEPHRADVWFWQAFRTNPAGYADDQMHLLLPVFHEEATLVESPTHGPLYLHRMGDVGQAAYHERLLTAYQADYLPHYYPAQPSGSRADVQAKGRWHDHTWTIEFGRQLDTPNDDDLSFTAGNVYLFAVSCYEMASGAVEPQLTQPLYYSGDVFDRLLLRIARGDEE